MKTRREFKREFNKRYLQLCGSVNRQNYRFYAQTNPHIVHEKPLHDARVTVWCGVTAKRVIGPYFFEDDRGKAVTINGDRYRKMLREFLLPQVRRYRMRYHWFQQDGATAHTAPETMSLLHENFTGRIISKNGDFAWPSNSPG